MFALIEAVGHLTRVARQLELCEPKEAGEESGVCEIDETVVPAANK